MKGFNTNLTKTDFICSELKGRVLSPIIKTVGVNSRNRTDCGKSNAVIKNRLRKTGNRHRCAHRAELTIIYKLKACVGSLKQSFLCSSYVISRAKQLNVGTKLAQLYGADPLLRAQIITSLVKFLPTTLSRRGGYLYDFHLIKTRGKMQIVGKASGAATS